MGWGGWECQAAHESLVLHNESIWSPPKGLRVKFRCVFPGAGSGSPRVGIDGCWEVDRPGRRLLGREA